MIFNSIEFLIFFFTFFICYWFIFNKNVRTQNGLILLASYIFYAWWNWRCLYMILLTSILNYLFGNWISSATTSRNKRALVVTILILNIGSLVLFKYSDFFISAINRVSLANGGPGDFMFKVIVPLGISFYTFRMISYILDIKNEKIEPSNDFLAFCCYVAFFPSLVSGPIDKAKSLLPQFKEPRVFNYPLAKDAMLQILWGWLKKAVIADNCAIITDHVFADYEHLPSSWLVLGAFLYTIQIYADFSGYSDMAIGLSKLIGFRIAKNFDFPLFAQNIAEFWRRWHMSLTNWLTEYIFTPLSIYFRDYGKAGLIAAILINFTLIGIWHGNKWSFVAFGFLHGCYYIPLIGSGTFTKRKKEDRTKRIPSLNELVGIAITSVTVMLTFVLFRAEDVHVAWGYFKNLFSLSILQVPHLDSSTQLIKLILIFAFIVVEWLGRSGDYGVQMVAVKYPRAAQLIIYYGLITLIFVFAGSNQQFIYFQF